MKIFGNYTALITPFKKNGQVDYKKLEDLVLFQVANNTDGIVALGATAEAHLLNEQEKRKIMQIIVKNTCKSAKIIAGLTSTSTEDSIQEANARFIDGADAILVCSPSYIKPTQTGLYNHFSKIADLSLLPIILYNNPSRTGTNLEYETIKKLSEHPNIIGIKEASTDLSHLIKLSTLANDNFSLICGNDEFLLPLLSLKASASISVIGNIAPDIVHNIISEYHSDPLQSIEIFNQFAPIIEALSTAPNPIAIKYIMQRLDMCKANYRQPLCPPDQKTKSRICNLLHLLDL